MEALKLEDKKILLSTSEVANLCNTSVRTVQNWIKTGKISSVQLTTNKGRGGVTHMISLSDLNQNVQKKYFKINNPNSNAIQVNAQAPTYKRLDEFSKSDREIIQRWINAINDWQLYRSRFVGQKTVVDKEWVAINKNRYKLINLSVDTLYSKWKALRNNDYEGLVDKRGRWAQGKTSIPELAWEIFKYYYLDENQHPITKCYQYTQWYLEKELPELLYEVPSYDAFYRAVKTIPYAVVKYFREGDKAFEDEAAPHISRMYDCLEVGEVWVADGYTLDVMTIEDGIERIHRLTVISFMDARSKLITGWHITDNPSSEGVLLALRKGILKYGIPKYVYVDNGREFLCFDIGGRGHRKQKNTEDHTPPGVFARLGIEMWNARVRNGKAKIIERSHKEYKESFCRLIEGFCGGRPEEKPEKLKKTLKTRRGMILDSELIQSFETYIEGMYNMTPSKGMGMYGRSPLEVYNDCLISKREAPFEELNLMLMRSTRMQTVGRKGVELNLYGEKLFYWTSDFLFQYQNQKVYVRFDPEDLRTVRIYDDTDKYLCTVPCDDETILKYGCSKEDVKTAHQKIRHFKKTVKDYNENSAFEAYEKIDAFSLMLWKAKKNLQESPGLADAKVVEVVRANESAEYLIDDYNENDIDLEKMAKIAKLNAI